MMDALAIVNTIATVVIAASTYVGYVSLRTTKEQAKLEDCRKKRIFAVELTERFNQVLLIKHADIAAADRKSHKQNLEGFDPAPYKPSEGILQETAILLNMLETWALYVETELANEQLLLHMCGEQFCEIAIWAKAIIRTTTTFTPAEWRVVDWLVARWEAKLEKGEGLNYQFRA